MLIDFCNFLVCHPSCIFLDTSSISDVLKLLYCFTRCFQCSLKKCFTCVRIYFDKAVAEVNDDLLLS